MTRGDQDADDDAARLSTSEKSGVPPILPITAISGDGGGDHRRERTPP